MKRATQRWIIAGIAGMALLMAAQAVFATDVTFADRVYANYTQETATVPEGQVRLEVRGLALQKEPSSEDQNELDPWINVAGVLQRPQGQNALQNLSGGVIDLLGSYGLGKHAEVGFDIPGYVQSERFTNLSTGQTSTVNNSDIGDILLYTKFNRAVAKHCWAGGGMQISLPNGPLNKGFGMGATGFTPFINTRYQRGAFALGANLGYEIYTGMPKDVFNYGAEAIVRGSDTYALRVEVAGRVFENEGTRFNDAMVYPGIDVKITDRLTVRPTGMAHLTDIALDWGVGLGVATTF